MHNSISAKIKNFFLHKKEQPAQKIKKHWVQPEKKEMIVTILNRYSILFHILLACSITFVIEWVSRHSFQQAFLFIFDRSLVFLYNSFLIFVSLLLVYLFRRRVVLRTLISTFWLFLGIINSCILLKRVTPFSYTDLKMVNDLFTMQSNYFTNTEAVVVILGVSAVIFLMVFLFIKGPKYAGKPKRFASIISIAAFSFLIPIVTAAGVNSHVLASYFENIAQGYNDYGFVYSFSASVVDQGMREPENYNDEAVTNALNSGNLKKTTAATDKKPNIVYVLLESFVDPTEINFLQFDQDPVPNFHKLQNMYTSGHLQVPVVGAGTANTEFEVLTGMGMQFFGLGEYPYKTVLKDTSVESVASVLHKQDYGTHVVHNNGGNFYSRANAFSQMGFDTFSSKEMMNIQEYTPIGTWPTDHILINEVKKSMDSTVNKSDFVYTITVQGHGSYPTQKVLMNPEITVTGAKTPEENNAWEYYVNQIHEVDKFIGDLIESLDSRKEDTMLVLFGDHLPTMGLTEADMATGSIFKTKYVTWNNFGLPKENQDLATYQLVSSTLDQLDIHEGTLLGFHQNNNYNYTDEYAKNMNMLQYDLLYGDKFAYQGQDLYPPSDLVMGVSDIILSRLVPSGDNINIIGQNFTPWSKVYVNGEKVSTNFINSTQLTFSMDHLSDGNNGIVVNQMGSSNTVFRTSNELSYYHVIPENTSE
jgi:phosphoglycerol transferase MdoB-like AlkP superfamily enzyme